MQIHALHVRIAAHQHGHDVILIVDHHRRRYVETLPLLIVRAVNHHTTLQHVLDGRERRELVWVGLAMRHRVAHSAHIQHHIAQVRVHCLATLRLE